MRFLIEYHTYIKDFFEQEAEAIEEANTLDELIRKLDNVAFKYDYAVIYHFQPKHNPRTFKVNLREWRDIINEERRQDY